MAFIDNFRIIQPQILIEKNDLGTMVDVKQYVSKMSVDYGDVSGAGTQANDGCPAVANLTIKNDDLNNFNPLDRNSTWNKKVSDGSYLPFLWNNRNIKITSNIAKPVYATENVIGNGSNIYTASRTDIIPFSVTIKRVIGVSPLMSTIGTYKFTDNYLGKQLGSYTFEELYATGGVMEGCGVNYINGQFNFGKAIPSGTVIEVQYMVATYSGMTIFDGILGDDISPSEYEVNLTVRDKTKLLMDTIIMRDKLRAYNATGTSSAPVYIDSKTLIAYNDGVPIEIYIANLLEDMLGVGVMALYVPTSPSYVLKPSNDIIQYQTLWNAINGVVTSIGWYIGFRHINESTGYGLTLLEPPRTKTTADYAFTHTDDFYTATGKLDFASIRNYITVKHIDADGAIQSQYAADAASMLNYGIKDLVIETENTKGITTATGALNMAQKILSDLKDARITTQIEMPFFPFIKPFDTLSLSYPKLSSTVDFYAVESVRHDFDFEGNRYRTILSCTGQVRGGTARWQKIATRPGKYEPVTANKLTESYSYAPPTGLTVNGTGIIFSGTAVNVQASVSFIKPILDNPVSYELQYKKSADEWEKATKLITKDVSFNIVLPTSGAFDFRIASLAKNGDRGDWSSVVTYTPSTSTLLVTDADLDGTRDNTLYIKTQAQFDIWINNVCSLTPVTVDYSKVVICEGVYSSGSIANPRYAININKDNFSLIGRGKVIINWCTKNMQTDYNCFWFCQQTNLSISNIWVNIYGDNTNAVTAGFIQFSVLNSAEVNPNIAIRDCTIKKQIGTVAFTPEETLSSTNSTIILDNNVIILDYFTLTGYSYYYPFSTIILTDNKIYLATKPTAGYPMLINEVAYLQMQHNYIEINEPTSLTDCISIKKSQLTYDTQILFNDNTIKLNVVRPTFILKNSTQPTKTQFNASNNKIIFNINQGSNAGTSVKFTGGTTYTTLAATVTGNICLDLYPNYLSLYANAPTIAAGTNTVNIAGATMQTDLKIGQKILILGQVRTIQTIPSQTSLTVDTNWITGGSGTAYFEKASIQTWLNEATGSRNNIVSLNTNNSY